MKFITALPEADRTALEQAHRDAPNHRQRQRAQAILLSARGYTLEQLADLFQVHRDTISAWLDAWQARGLAGLQDAPKTGCPPKIDAGIKTYLHEMLKNPSPNLKALVLDDLKKTGPSDLGQCAARPATGRLLVPPRPMRSCQSGLPQEAGPREARSE